MARLALRYVAAPGDAAELSRRERLVRALAARWRASPERARTLDTPRAYPRSLPAGVMGAQYGGGGVGLGVKLRQMSALTSRTFTWKLREPIAVMTQVHIARRRGSVARRDRSGGASRDAHAVAAARRRGWGGERGVARVCARLARSRAARVVCVRSAVTRPPRLARRAACARLPRAVVVSVSSR